MGLDESTHEDVEGKVVMRTVHIVYTYLPVCIEELRYK